MNTGLKTRLALHWSGVALGMVLCGISAWPEAGYSAQPMAPERQITHTRSGHILTNFGVWSPDGQWIVYDTRSDAAGAVFDGERIEMVNVATGEVRILYQSRNEAHCGVALFHPLQRKVVFILGPEHPSADWQYSACHRDGVVVDISEPGKIWNLDARDISPPFTPGALRGGSHVHVWDAAGEWVSFTYEDHVLSRYKADEAGHECNLRNVGVTAPIRPVLVPKGEPRNHDGAFFSVLVTRTVSDPKPGSDEISKASEEGWVGTNGYVRADGKRQEHALAFQGQLVTEQRKTIAEVFIVDLPGDPTIAGAGPLQGTESTRPVPPNGTVQRRLTFSANRKYPGVQGPRHWLRSSPDGGQIAFLMRDDQGIVQLWTISPSGGAPRQLTNGPHSIGSSFTWSPDGHWVAHLLKEAVCITDTRNGQTRSLTGSFEGVVAPRPEACVFSPDGKQIAYVRPVWTEGQYFNQVFVVETDSFQPR